MTTPSITGSTVHMEPTRNQADLIVRHFADQYHQAETGSESLEEFNQYVRAVLSPALHADVRPKHFEDVLEAWAEVVSVEDGNHELLTAAPDDNYPDLLDTKMQALAFAIRYLLDAAGFGFARAAA